jgi:hypothetical protein
MLRAAILQEIRHFSVLLTNYSTANTIQTSWNVTDSEAKRKLSPGLQQAWIETKMSASSLGGVWQVGVKALTCFLYSARFAIFR